MSFKVVHIITSIMLLKIYQNLFLTTLAMLLLNNKFPVSFHHQTGYLLFDKKNIIKSIIDKLKFCKNL